MQGVAEVVIRTRARPARQAIATAVAAALLPLASGCSGFVSGSSVENVDNVATGSNARAGNVLVRQAFVLGPPPGETIPQGGRAAVYLTLYDRSEGPGAPARPDRLVAASAGQTAGSVELSGGPIEVPPNTLVNVTHEEGQLALSDLGRPLSGGESIRLTLRFERGGRVTFSVPVVPRSEAFATLSPLPASPTPQPTGTPSPSPTNGSPSPEENATASPTAAP